MAIEQTLCTSFKLALLNGEMDFSGDTAQTFKVALFTSSATLGASTTAYSTDNEVSGTGYTAGGEELTIAATATSGGVAYVDFDNVTWSAASFTARGALIYKADGGDNPAVAVLDFGEDETVSSGNFTIQFPTAAATSAIIRVS